MPYTPQTWTDGVSSVSAARMNYIEAGILAAAHEWHYSEITTDLTVSATTEGTATAVLAGAAVTYDGTPVMVAAHFPSMSSASGAIFVVLLCDGATVLGELARMQVAAATPAQFGGPYMSRRFTPSAASHTYNIKAYVASNNVVLECGAGGSATLFPRFLRITAA